MNPSIENYYRKFDCYDNGGNNGWKHYNNPQTLGLTLVSYGDVKHEQGDYIEVPYTTYSDYSGGTVENSNCRTFLDIFKEFLGENMWEMYGGYGTTGVLIRKSLYENNSEVQETIDALFDYPVISEDDWTELEMKIQNEAWDSWVKQDLTFELEKRGIKFKKKSLEQDFYYVSDAIGEYYIHEDAVSAFIHTDIIADAWVKTLSERDAIK
jgi:hypothetical protein